MAAYGGDGSAQRLQAIVSTAAKKARMVMMGGNDAEILTIAARVADTGPCAPRSPPGPPPQQLRQWQPPAQPCTPPGPPPQYRLDEQEPWAQWSPVTPADPDDLWANWHGTHKRGIDKEDSDDESVMAHTDVGDYRHAHEPAPTFISMAAPLNAKGQLSGPGGQILHIDSSGHVLNENNERCDLHGRITRPGGARTNAFREKSQMQYWDWTKRPGLVTKESDGSDCNDDDWREDDWNNNEWKNWGWNQRSRASWIATAVPPPPPVDEPEGQPQAQGAGQPQAHGSCSSSSTDRWASRGWTKEEWAAFLDKTKK